MITTFKDIFPSELEWKFSTRAKTIWFISFCKDSIWTVSKASSLIKESYENKLTIKNMSNMLVSGDESVNQTIITKYYSQTERVTTHVGPNDDAVFILQ